MKRNINKLFANMCCSECGADFTEESINILREEDEFSVLQVVCSKCGKSFGIAFLGESGLAVKGGRESADSDYAFELQEGPGPVSADDVIDAHKFIKNLGADWRKHLPKEYREDKTNRDEQ